MHPRWVPQLADAEALLARSPGAGRPVPGAGAQRTGPRPGPRPRRRDIAIFGSATESFAQRNLNRTMAESLEMFAPVVAGPGSAAWGSGLPVDVLRRPLGGRVPIPQVVEPSRLIALGCTELCLGDTIGVATPGQVGRCSALVAAGLASTPSPSTSTTPTGRPWPTPWPRSSRGDDRRRERRRARRLPYAESATGNLATEDLLWQLHGLGIATGIDLPKLVDTSAWMAAARPAQPVPGGPGPGRLSMPSKRQSKWNRPARPAVHRDRLSAPRRWRGRGLSGPPGDRFRRRRPVPLPGL